MSQELKRVNINGTVGANVVAPGDVVGDPKRAWVQSTAEEYIDSEIEKVKNWVSNTPVTDVSILTQLPASGDVNTLYRIAGTNTYSEYGWDGTQFVKLDEKDYGIDDVPTVGSNNLVKSGGVYDCVVRKIEITDFDVKPNNISTDGTYGNRYNRGIIETVGGEHYQIKNTGSLSNVRYAFVVTDSGIVGEALDLVESTSVVTVDGNSTSDFIIPEGCNFLIFNALSGYYSEVYRIAGVHEEIDILDKKIKNESDRAESVENELTDRLEDVEEQLVITSEVTETNVATQNVNAVGNYYYQPNSLIVLADGSIVSGTSRRVTCFVEIGYGVKINVYLPNDTTKASHAIYDENLNFIESYRQSGEVTISLQSGAKYVRWCAADVTSYTRIVSSQIYNALKDYIDSNVDYIRGEDAISIKSDNLNNDLSIEQFPFSNKFGDKYNFICKVSSFNGISICKGVPPSYGASWFEIDSQNVSLYNYYTNSSRVAQVAHGLSIQQVLNVNINVDSSGIATLTIQTVGGYFTHEFQQWGYNANGMLQVHNNGSVLTDCCLSATNKYFTCPIWIFGASFEGVADARWIGQMKSMGYFNYLLNAYAGRNGATAIVDFKRALKFGCPKYIYFPSSNDGNVETYISNVTQMKQLCDKFGITLILGRKANNKETDFSAYRTYVESSGLRYIDLFNALTDPSKTWSSGTDTWYSGFMSSDGKHPTEQGALAIALQACYDFPEMMQY